VIVYGFALSLILQSTLNKSGRQSKGNFRVEAICITLSEDDNERITLLELIDMDDSGRDIRQNGSLSRHPSVSGPSGAPYPRQTNYEIDGTDISRFQLTRFDHHGSRN